MGACYFGVFLFSLTPEKYGEVSDKQINGDLLVV